MEYLSMHLLSIHAHRALESLCDRALEEIGLRAIEYELLCSVARRPGRTVAEISRELSAKRTSVLKHLRRLEKRGWIELRRVNRRRTFPRLTETGARLVAEAEAASVNADQRLQTSLAGTVSAGTARAALIALASIAKS
jgi:DNA-binding MarR family transcriptional regulator